jgi:hypothetical protein
MALSVVRFRERRRRKEEREILRFAQSDSGWDRAKRNGWLFPCLSLFNGFLVRIQEGIAEESRLAIVGLARILEAFHE